jgi:hypothetical protein
MVGVAGHVPDGAYSRVYAGVYFSYSFQVRAFRDASEEFIRLARAKFLDEPSVVSETLEQHLQSTAYYRISTEDRNPSSHRYTDSLPT